MKLVIKPLASTKIAGEIYDAEEFVLYLMFPNGGLYAYGNDEEPFAPEFYAEFMAAPSKGQFFNQRIAGPDRRNPIYPFRRIGDKSTFFKIGEEVPFKEKLLFITDEDLPQSMFDPDPRNVPASSHKIIDQKLDASASNHVAKQEVALSTTVIPNLPDDLDALALHAVEVKQQVEGLTRMEGIRVALVVTDAEGYTNAANLLVKLKAEQKLAQVKVDAAKKPAYEAYKALLDKEKEVIGPYKVAIEQLLDPACTAWRQQQREKERLAELEQRRVEQKRLDDEAAEKTAEAKRLAESQAKAMEAAGAPEIAEKIRQAPIVVAAPEAPTQVIPTAVPKVAGIAVRGTWKWRYSDKEQVPKFFTLRIVQAMHDYGYEPTAAAKPIDALLVEFGKIFADLYSLDDVKVGSRTKLKEASIGSVPGVDYYFNETTGSSGR